MVDSFLEYMFTSTRYSEQDRLEFILKLVNSIFKGILLDKRITSYEVRGGELVFLNCNRVAAKLKIDSGYGDFPPCAGLVLYNSDGSIYKCNTTVYSCDIKYLVDAIRIIGDVEHKIFSDLRCKNHVLYDGGDLLVVETNHGVYRALIDGNYEIIDDRYLELSAFYSRGIVVAINTNHKPIANTYLGSLSVHWIDVTSSVHTKPSDVWALGALKDANTVVFENDKILLMRVYSSDFLHLTGSASNCEGSSLTRGYLLFNKCSSEGNTLFGYSYTWIG